MNEIVFYCQATIENNAETPVESDNENIDSVSTFDQPLNQTRLIPCKYAIRGGCQSGEKCPYSHHGKYRVVFIRDFSIYCSL